ncbi:MAG: sulfatase/phosphatase domain-containing protein, partial [Actinomycetota bacterium]
DKPEHIRSMPTPDERDIRMINRRYRHRVRLMLGVDDMIGELISTLHELGALSDTYIIVSSDNGWMQGEHRLAKRKLAPYEESSRLPLFVRGPGIAPGISTDEPVSMVDIFATLSDLAGGTEQRDGRSLVPLFDGGETDWRDWLLLENLSGKHDVPNYFGVVGKTHKYIEYQTGETELYDLTADPRETSSIHESADPALLAQLSARVAAVRACAGPTCRSADTDP